MGAEDNVPHHSISDTPHRIAHRAGGESAERVGGDLRLIPREMSPAQLERMAFNLSAEFGEQRVQAQQDFAMAVYAEAYAMGAPETERPAAQEVIPAIGHGTTLAQQEAFACEHLVISAHPQKTLWDIESAPLNQEVRVQAGEMTFLAKRVPGAGMNEDGTLCDQWQATREGEHPSCWSDGVCYDSNVDSLPSLQPTCWWPPAEIKTDRAGGGEAPIDRIAEALWLAEDPANPPWAEWVSYAQKHPPHRASVDKFRRMASVALAAQPNTEQGEAGKPGPRTISQETFERVRGALEELVECATLRGDNELPHPADDPKTWTARMADAWGDAQSALDETCELSATPATTAALLSPRAGVEVFDYEPDFGCREPEPSLRRLVRGYYGPHFSPAEADALTDRYFAALAAAPAPQSSEVA